MAGIAVGGLVAGAENMSGVAVGGLCTECEDVADLQLAGGFNIAKRVRGVQIGIANVCEELKGVQVGLINSVGDKLRWPIINARF